MIRAMWVVAALALGGCSGGGSGGDGGGSSGDFAKKVYSRREFRSLLLGRKPEEVIAAGGRPSETQDLGGMVFWYYENYTVDEVTGKKDFMTQVSFDGGVVEGVSFH